MNSVWFQGSTFTRNLNLCANFFRNMSSGILWMLCEDGNVHTHCSPADSTCCYACEWQESLQHRHGNRYVRPWQFCTTSAVLGVPCTARGTLSPLHRAKTSLLHQLCIFSIKKLASSSWVEKSNSGKKSFDAYRAYTSNDLDRLTTSCVISNIISN